MTKKPADNSSAPPTLTLAASSPHDADPRATAVERLVLFYLQKHGIRPDLDTLMWHDGSEAFLSREIAERVWRENSQVALPLFVITLQEIARRLRIREVQRLRDELLSDTVPDGAAEELEAFVKLIAAEDTPPERLDYYVSVFRQLIWQVKRKLRGLQSHWDLMPVLVGPQAGGKSTAVARFSKPLSILYLADADFEIFTDNFRIVALHRYYLVCLDEMGRARSADLERVKQRITATTVQARAMRSEQERRLTRHASFIGTSNHPLSDTVADSTGMRRFAEIHCRTAPWSEEFGQQLRDIDFELLWRVETGINSSAPIYEHRDVAERYQSESRTLSPFDYFVELHLVEGDESDLVSLREIYSRYVAFECMQARKPMAQQTFAKCMETRFGWGIKPRNARHWRKLKLLSDVDEPA